MGRIAVFDSGLGSLSIIRPIRRVTRSDIIYLADQAHFPYGVKSREDLEPIIRGRIIDLTERFGPSLVVVGSNTPSLLLPHLIRGDVVGVTPPLQEAADLSRTGSIAILATRSVVNSAALTRFIDGCHLPAALSVSRIDASALVLLVESGEFIRRPDLAREAIRGVLERPITNGIDAITLSSTHLPFLKQEMEREFPGVRFLDPGEAVARLVRRRLVDTTGSGRLEIFTSADPHKLQGMLSRLGIHETVRLFT